MLLISKYLFLVLQTASNNTDTMQLGVLKEPPPVAFTFDAIGWKIVFALLLVLIFYILYRWYQHYQHNAYRREAIAEVHYLKTQTNLSLTDYSTSLFFLLKNTALQAYDKKEVAALKGDNWLQFLDTKAKGTSFVKYKDLLVNATYKGKVEEKSKSQIDNFTAMCIKWIKNHA